MLAFHLIGSFPSNELNTPHSIHVAGSAILIAFVMLLLIRMRSVVLGVFIGALACACASWFLFWPQTLREPRASNPGPFVVTVGAVLGGIAGLAFAILGKLLNWYLARRRISRNVDEEPFNGSHDLKRHESTRNDPMRRSGSGNVPDE